MFADLTSRPFNENAYSDLPFAFLDQAALNDLANVTAINLIENGDRAARENWQNRRLTFLLGHAQARSGFWRQQLPSRTIDYRDMKYLPVQSRQDIAAQAKQEGSLVAMEGQAPVASYASTGSTGVPVKVYVCPENGYYNSIRSLAQYFFYNLSLDEDRVQITPAANVARVKNKPLAVESADGWAGAMSKVFRNGSNKKIIDWYDEDALITELSKIKFGYLVCPNRYLDIMMNHGGVEFIRKLGIKLWLHLSDYRDPEIVKALKGIGVSCLSNYSSGETGPMAFECPKNQGYFHVAHTNVVVEQDDQQSVSFDGASLGRLLVTHLHSYATPIIRYDIGDFGQVAQQCPCGHDGPTISKIFGRGKHFLRHPSGKLVPFYASTRTLMETVDFKEFRVRQDELNTITVEVSGRETITPDEEANLKKYLIKASDPAFNITIKTVREIDWSDNPKRLFFASSVA